MVDPNTFNLRDVITAISFLIGLGIVYGKLTTSHKDVTIGQKSLVNKVDTMAEKVVGTDYKLTAFIETEKVRHENIDVAIDEIKGDNKRNSRDIVNLKIKFSGGKIDE